VAGSIEMNVDWLPDKVLSTVAAHALSEPGAYRRWSPPEPSFNGQPNGKNAYGCADAVNILYTLDRMPTDVAERSTLRQSLQALQDVETGLFYEATHHPIHTTAHCVAALELLNTGPTHPVNALEGLALPGAVGTFLEGLDWRGDPWRASHQGAGLFAVLTATRRVTLAWQDEYFDWLWEHTDSTTGLITGGVVPEPLKHQGVQSLVPYMAGTFHYLFNFEWARRPLRRPSLLIDTCLEIFDDDIYPLGTQLGFAEVDWVYCVTRAVGQTGHRFEEARERLEIMCRRLLRLMWDLNTAAADCRIDLHELFGTLCALAELQRAVPGSIRTQRPLRLVLDRRPFI